MIMKKFQKVLLQLQTAKVYTGGKGVVICPGPAKLKSMTTLISEEAAIYLKFSQALTLHNTLQMKQQKAGRVTRLFCKLIPSRKENA